MKISTQTATAALLALLLSARPASANTVYNNLDIPIPFLGSTVFVGDFGNTVTLAGTARNVTSVSVGLKGLFGGDPNLQLQLWTADGPGGTPGSLIWQSGYLNFPIVEGDAQTITFTVPAVPVPDSLFWDVATQSGGSQGGLLGDPATVGTTGQGWVNLIAFPQFASETGPFMADIEATVPEPSVPALLGIAALLLARARRRC